MIHILVVDDDEKLTQSICSYLNNCGYEAKGMPMTRCTAVFMI